MKPSYHSTSRRLVCIFLALLFLTLQDSASQEHQIRKVACIGNSITEGSGIDDKEHYSYPAQLQAMLGSGWVVKNFGVGGRTLLTRGDYPYRNEEAFTNAKLFNPDVVIIKLGTNDTKPWNWKFKDDFISDYTKLIRDFQNLPSHPRVYICRPVPAFPGAWGIRDSIIRTDLLPLVDEVAGKNHTPIIDLYTPFIATPDLFPDKVHPDENGAREIARIIYHTLCVDFHQTEAPAPIQPIPSIRQLAWQEQEYYGFIHFGLNTFTDKEWGYGDEPESLFNPINFDADVIVRNLKNAGMSGLIITAKHHDGFCLWPSQYTGHSVKNSPWRGGNGDVIKELSDACRKSGLKFGVYLSPWDRNNKTYGTPEYITYYRNQLRELLTNYGEISEVWFDGANGGDGYYGGARETRTIDRKTYYDWPGTWKIVRQLQPNAVIFSDVGPDIRWVGNENGYAGETCWSMYTPKGEQNDAPAPGYTKYQEATDGHRDGKAWLPAECDVSIRPGWFYHASQDTMVKSTQKLFELYLQSVGRNGSLLLNVPLDQQGEFNQHDIDALMGFRQIRDSIFSDNRMHTSTATASNIRGNDIRFSPANVLDTDHNSYWACDDSVHNPSLTIELGKHATVNYILLQEFIPLGQRIESFTVEGYDGTQWKEMAKGTTIGHKRILPLAPMMVNKIRLNILRSRACPIIENMEIY